MQAWEISDGRKREIIYAPTLGEAISYAARSVPNMSNEIGKLRGKRRPTLDRFYDGSMVMKRKYDQKLALMKLGWDVFVL